MAHNSLAVAEALGTNCVFTHQQDTGEPLNLVGSASECPCREVTEELPPRSCQCTHPTDRRDSSNCTALAPQVLLPV